MIKKWHQYCLVMRFRDRPKIYYWRTIGKHMQKATTNKKTIGAYIEKWAMLKLDTMNSDTEEKETGIKDI